jgi:hypothetical protein
VPFDRHDWVVDRCGQEVRYVIDFYFYDDKAGTPEVGSYSNQQHGSSVSCHGSYSIAAARQQCQLSWSR